MTKHWQSARWLPWLSAVGAGLLYLASRLIRLTTLPVFADEAIYIRWAQLILHEPSRYAFFSLNDGKPPLFIWMLTPFLTVANDPLWAGRLVSVVVGLGQLATSDWLVRRYGGNRIARLASASIILLAPFWFFHHRMALLDATLTLWLSVTIVGLTLIHFPGRRWAGVLVGGLGWGLALWTKTPALFLAPFFVAFALSGPWCLDHRPLRSLAWREWLGRLIYFGSAGLLGLLIFYSLRLQPNFGSLFGRSNDFTFTTAELLAGQWRTSLDNVGRLLQWLSAYLRPELLSLSAIALLLSRQNRRHWLWWLGAAMMAAPLVVYGRTLHPRYFLPVAPFLTLSAALFTAEAWQMVDHAKDGFFRLVFVVLVGFFLIGSLRFMLLSYFTPNQIPFVLADREQYLTSWSSGHGLTAIRDQLLTRARRGERTTVVTEGSFGTLPDGLLMYFDRAPEIQYLRIEGLEQYPVKYLPDWVRAEALDHPTWLVVNANRMEVPADQVKLLARYPRPYGATDLELYEVL